jgi:predicted RND superfamily exporter protein
MGWKGLGVKLSYDNASILPSDNSYILDYKAFKKMFGEDGSVIVIGVENPDMFKLKEFNLWYDLTSDMTKIEGVEGVMSITKATALLKNDSLHQFDFIPTVASRPTSQADVDSLRKSILSLKFYDGLLFNSKTDAYILAITLKKSVLNEKIRMTITDNIVSRAEKYEAACGHELHYSGLPYIRTMMARTVQHELFLFVLLSIIIAAFILYLFFRSFKVVASSLIVVGISIIFTLGLVGLFGFKISILTGVIPSLIVVIAIENCIYILNKYHWEYRNHGNKILALSRVVRRIGFASLMVNTATAAGFAAFILVSNQLLREFGIIAAISILMEYALCITLLPIIFSYMNPPSDKHVKHLDSTFFNTILEKILYIIQYKRKWVFSLAGILLVVGVIGMMNMRTSGKVTDDIHQGNALYKDLKFFETQLGGVMPFEISVDTKKKKGVMLYSTIQRIDRLQNEISRNKEFSKPLSVAEFVKFTKQAYFNGNPEMYTIPNSMEKTFVLSYLPKKTDGKQQLLNSFIDSTQQVTRISFQMADIGTKDMNRLLDSIRPRVDSIFSKADYNVKITGSSVVSTRGTEFLIKHLLISVLIAIGFISLLMALMFSSVRMIAVSMMPNIIPLIITAAIMGFTGVPIKPSTIIVFSIALGISVDNTIQYLSRYRHELKSTGNNIKLSTLNALREAGFSMIYTSIVLVLGFSVFMVSSFGGTQALGMLVSTTLFIAMFFNMIVLPSLLLVLDKYLTTKAFKSEPVIDIDDEEDELKEERDEE